jgi:hypothetical protein
MRPSGGNTRYLRFMRLQKTGLREGRGPFSLRLPRRPASAAPEVWSIPAPCAPVGRTRRSPPTAPAAHSDSDRARSPALAQISGERVQPGEGDRIDRRQGHPSTIARRHLSSATQHAASVVVAAARTKTTSRRCFRMPTGAAGACRGAGRCTDDGRDRRCPGRDATSARCQQGGYMGGGQVAGPPERSQTPRKV